MAWGGRPQAGNNKNSCRPAASHPGTWHAPHYTSRVYAPAIGYTGCMYDYVLIAHSLWRWVVIIAGAAAIASAAMGLVRQAPAGPAGLYGRLFGIAVDIQFLMGASLYLVFSPMTTVALNVAEGLPQGSDLAFFGVYHGLIMTIAFLDVHVSAVLIRRAKTDAARQRRSIFLYGQTLLLILLTIPWWRPLLRV